MGQCISPYSKRNELTGVYDCFPCGKCLECRRRHVSGWAFRLTKEGQRATSAFFVTFTYEENNVPLTINGLNTLKKLDIQLFFKRLRKQHAETNNNSNHPIKYYVCGEYGTKSFRPHYHAILFNADKEKILQAWGLGHIHIGEASEASIGYTLKYMCKPRIIPQHKNDDRQKEFSLMSKKWVPTTYQRRW